MASFQFSSLCSTGKIAQPLGGSEDIHGQFGERMKINENLGCGLSLLPGYACLNQPDRIALGSASTVLNEFRKNDFSRYPTNEDGTLQTFYTVAPGEVNLRCESIYFESYRPSIPADELLYAFYRGSEHNLPLFENKEQAQAYAEAQSDIRQDIRIDWDPVCVKARPIIAVHYYGSYKKPTEPESVHWSPRGYGATAQGKSAEVFYTSVHRKDLQPISGQINHELIKGKYRHHLFKPSMIRVMKSTARKGDENEKAKVLENASPEQQVRNFIAHNQSGLGS